MAPNPPVVKFKYAFINTFILIAAFAFIGIGCVWISYVISKVFEFGFEPIVQENNEGQKKPL